MLHVTLLSHGFQSEYEIGFANSLARNGVDVLLIGSDNTQTTRAAATLKILNLRGSQDPRRPRLAKAWNVVRYILAYLAYLAAQRGAHVHLIGMFTTGSTALSLLEAWLTRLVAGRYVLTVHNLLPHDRHGRANQAIPGVRIETLESQFIEGRYIRKGGGALE